MPTFDVVSFSFCLFCLESNFFAMPYVIPSSDFIQIIEGRQTELKLVEVPVENLKNTIGFTYRWLPKTNATVTVTYLPYNNTMKTGINANLTVLKAAVKRNPCDYYWMDCICVPQDPASPDKFKEISNMRSYYSGFKRVVFLGDLKDSATLTGEFDLVS